ncbi:unnamed protein product [Mytilus coruscus]|uniref:Uncharacterized protein n=1 Tax=Mytilus coruscus TaxID=42192 RepID=A0A6J8CMF7_MYTCO|nr:unnamed protein product [Mytilus coruscus]
MSELQHQYESTMAEKEGDFFRTNGEHKRERQTLMDKVMEQAPEMDKGKRKKSTIECLRDKALKFVGTHQETVQKDYDMLVQKLSQRFEIKIYLTPLGASVARDEESTECLIRQVKTGNNSGMQDLQKKYETMETKWQLKNNIWTIKSDIKKKLSIQSVPKPLLIARGRLHQEDEVNQRCYGMYNATCRKWAITVAVSKKSWSPMRRNRSPSPNNNLREGTLNEQGLKI